jgi:hypothetical protein
VPGACQTGAASDCIYDKPLTREEAQKCIGTPAANRWSLVQSADVLSVGVGLKVSLAPGVYRFDGYHSSSGYGSAAIVVSKDYQALITKYGGNATGVVIDTVNPTFVTASNNTIAAVDGDFLVQYDPRQSFSGADVFQTPGVSLGNMIQVPRTAAIYKLD